jgi:hypothetical protein
MKLIGFDLGNALAPSMGIRYGRVLPVPMSPELSGTEFDPLVDFVALVMRFSSVIEVHLPLRLDFMHTIQREKGLQIFAIISH